MKAKVRMKRDCSPEMCDHCQYIGEGDFICDLHIDDPVRVCVMEDWEPTDNYLQCQRREEE